MPRRSRSAVSSARCRTPGTAMGRPATRTSSGPRTPNSTSCCSLVTPVHCTAMPTGAPAAAIAGLPRYKGKAGDRPGVRHLYASCTRPGRRCVHEPPHRPRQREGGGPMTTNTDVDAREALAERLVDDVTRSLETLSVYLGLELGLYQTLSDLEPATEAEVAARAGIALRYAREWLEQQASAGYVVCDDPTRPAEARRYRLPAGHAEVLLDRDSPYHVAPVAIMLAGVARVLPELLEAYRTGGGVPYAAYGPQIRRGIAAANRPMFLHELASAWLPAVPDIDRRLRTAPPSRVLDLGCGLGASSIALARAYPRARVVGVDLDEASVTEARAEAAEAGVADRVTFVVGDAAHVASETSF